MDVGWTIHADWEVVAAMEVPELGRLRDHAARARRAGASTSEAGALRWNRAGDAEVNDDLVEGAMVPAVAPDQPSDLGGEAGGLAESYYELVPDGPRRWDCGSGCDGLPRPWERGEGPVSPRDADWLRCSVAAAVQRCHFGDVLVEDWRAGRAPAPLGRPCRADPCHRAAAAVRSARISHCQRPARRRRGGPAQGARPLLIQREQRSATRSATRRRRRPRRRASQRPGLRRAPTAGETHPRSSSRRRHSSSSAASTSRRCSSLARHKDAASSARGGYAGWRSSANNPALRALVQSLSILGQDRWNRAVQSMRKNRDVALSRIQGHREILGALRSRDPDAVEQAFRRHATTGVDLLLNES